MGFVSEGVGDPSGLDATGSELGSIGRRGLRGKVTARSREAECVAGCLV